jgi:xanthine dehydrogenase accessory factor
MVDIYAELHRALMAGENCVLARIIRQLGSAPRTVGTKLLAKADGTAVGTIGGGVLEHEVLRKAQAVLASGRTALLEVRLTGSDVAASEMLCGGNVDVLLEPVLSDDAGAASVFQELAAMTAQGRRGTLVTVAFEGQRAVTRFMITSEGRVSGDAAGLSGVAGSDLKRWASARGPGFETAALAAGRALIFIEPLDPQPVLMLFGAGHISTFVATLASMVGFRVWVIDDRADFANAARFPTADQVLVCPVTEAFERLAVTPASYIVIVTRGHIHDRDVLRAALRTRPAYLGMIGSRRKRDLIYASLIAEGVAVDDLRRVHCPIGISIDAETPQEIAVSIAAELIQTRAQALAGRRPAAEIR